MDGFDFGVIQRSLGYLFKDGMVFTLELTLFATAGGLVLGTLLALCRLSRSPLLSSVAAVYVNFLRALPLILVIFWFYFLMPYVAAWLLGADHPLPIAGFTSALITFTLFEAAYYCEIMRAGIQSVAEGQFSAARALGLSHRQMMATVILPQAFRNMMPVLLTQSIVLFQDTSLVYVLSLTDFFGAATNVAQRDGRLMEMYLFAGLVYFAMSYCASLVVRYVERRTYIIR